MKHILESNEFKSRNINEGKIDNLVKSWMTMDIEDIGNEEADIEDFISSGGKKKDVYKAIDKLTKSIDSNSKDEYIAAMEILLGESINEAQKYDIEAAIRKIREFNRGNYKQFKSGDIEELSADILKDLGLKLNSKNVDAVIDHIGMSMDDKGKIPVDKDLVKELYAITE